MAYLQYVTIYVYHWLPDMQPPNITKLAGGSRRKATLTFPLFSSKEGRKP